MNAEIVSGGGWRKDRVQRVKVKACAALFLAVGLGFVSALLQDSAWFYCWIPAALLAVCSFIFFVVEKPREVKGWRGMFGEDIDKLYGSSKPPC